MARPRHVVQEQETLRPERVRLHRTKSKGANEVHHRKFSVTFTFFISDRRIRDVDGMTTTILDCLVRAGALEDDSRFHVPEIHSYSYDCPKGEERVEVEIVPK
jgi:Holliday junction resolvase RusA-like endonuclease